MSAIAKHLLDTTGLSLESMIHERFCPYPFSAKNYSHRIGLQQSTQQGRGMEYHETRPYQVGDDVRSIDWRVTARTNKTHTKVYTEDKDSSHLFIIDLQGPMQVGTQWRLKSIQAAHLAINIAWQVHQAHQKLGALLLANTDKRWLPPQSHASMPLTIINQLINFQQDAFTQRFSPDRTLQTTFKRPPFLTTSSLHLHIFTHLAEATQATEWLSRWQKKHRLFLYILHDPIESDPSLQQKIQGLSLNTGRIRGHFSPVDFAKKPFLHWCQQHQITCQFISCAHPLIRSGARS